MNMTFEKDPEQGWAVLTCCSECTEEDVVHIPAAVTLDGQNLPVRKIGKGAFENCPAKCIVLPDIYEIQDGAFKDAAASCIGVIEDSHHSVLPLSLQAIGREAFSGTQNLQDVTFPSASLSIGDAAFYKSGCRSLLFANTTRLTVGLSAFENSKIVEFFAPQLKSLEIPERCFAECSHLNCVHIEHGRISGIGSEGFLNCKNLLHIPAKQPLDHVGPEAFSGSSIAATGMFRKLRDYYQAYGLRHLTVAVLDILIPHHNILPLEYIQEKATRTREAAKTILKQLLSTESKENNYSLLCCAAKDLGDVENGIGLMDYFPLYRNNSIYHLHRIIDFDTTELYRFRDFLHPANRFLEDLTEDEVFHLLEYSLPCPLPDPTKEDILNATLLGNAYTFVDQCALDYMVRLVEERLYSCGTSAVPCFDIPNEEIHNFFPDDGYYTKDDIIHVLRDYILYNRISLYQQLKRAHTQLTS